RPTATLITTNFPNNVFAQTNCDYGISYSVTNLLTGLGPWTVMWNDGTNQTVGTEGQLGPVQLARTVLYPTNFFKANEQHTNVYFVTNVIGYSGCLANPSLGDITCRVELVVNPRPTAPLTTTNFANNLFAVTNCDYAISYQVTNLLTGLGPWTVMWNDGTNQTIGAAGQPGPLTLARTVLEPTNFSQPNEQHTNVYFVTNVTGYSGCRANPSLGDITGRVELVVNP